VNELARDAAIVVLTGAGISKESGLDTFRDPDGIWARHRIEDVATPEAFARSPKRVYEFYNYRRRTLLDPGIRPNAAHIALARLEAEWAGEVLIVTQNVDDLHERAGSRALIHMHGEHRKARCNACGHIAAHQGDLDGSTICSGCRQTGFMRPHVVWFGEMPLEMNRIQAALERASLFISIGTSGQVYPAAGFVRLARAVGALTVELNLEPSAGASAFDESRYGPATEVVPAFVDSLLSARG
jgi:NAD-dependent deacetylase